MFTETMMENPVPAVPTNSGHYSRHYAPAAAAAASGTLQSSLRRPPAAKSQRFARHQNGGLYSSREYLFYPQVRWLHNLLRNFHRCSPYYGKGAWCTGAIHFEVTSTERDCNQIYFSFMKRSIVKSQSVPH